MRRIAVRVDGLRGHSAADMDARAFRGRCENLQEDGAVYADRRLGSGPGGTRWSRVNELSLRIEEGRRCRAVHPGPACLEDFVIDAEIDERFGGASVDAERRSMGFRRELEDVALNARFREGNACCEAGKSAPDDHRFRHTSHIPLQTPRIVSEPDEASSATPRRSDIIPCNIASPAKALSRKFSHAM